MPSIEPPSIRVLSMSAIGPFSWRWPEETEGFDRGWVAVASVDGSEFQVRHGLGRRVVFGRSRIHSVTWVEGEPTVEGVEADDFARSEALMSLIKVTKRHLCPGDAVPEGYSAFRVAVMSEEAVGPYSPRSLAVKLRQDDIEGWTRHAVLRAAAWGRLRHRSERRSLHASTASGPAAAVAATRPAEDTRMAIASALLEYAEHQQATQGNGAEFTPNPEANKLIETDAFAFLVAVIFDQGVPAERAWLAPFLIRERLGHLDPARIAEDESAVRDAIAAPPKLHRYIDKMPGWLVLGAQRVMNQYGGDAEAIWSDRPGAGELQRRFDEFKGIGQKKAAMAVEILERDLGVPVDDLHRSDIAYDVHVRRVFLRTHLADYDDRDHMIAVARELHPERPGALDMPAWLIGRTWCRAGIPQCVSCPLTNVCPKDVERAALVTSA